MFLLFQNLLKMGKIGIRIVVFVQVVEYWNGRMVQCLYGTVSFVRWRMKKVREKGLYPLDKQLRLKSYHGFSLCFHGR